MQTAIKNYGFKTVKINGLNIYCCNLAIKRDNADPTPQIDGVTIHASTKLIGKNKREVPVFIIRFVTANVKEYEWMKTSVINLLQTHAYAQVTNKYAIMRGEALPKIETFELDKEEDGEIDLPY